MNNAILGALVMFLSMTLWGGLHKTCTITLKDHQGVYHMITGKEDD